MATTKTLTPTNQAITLAAFTEKPDNRTNVTNDDRLADAVNALNSNIPMRTFALITNQQIQNNTDMNTFTTTGTYAINTNASAGTMSNLPEANAGVVYVKSPMGTLSNSYIQQIYMPYNGLKIYSRWTNNGGAGWNSWEELGETDGWWEGISIPRATITVVANNRYHRQGNIVHLEACIQIDASETGNAYILNQCIPTFGKSLGNVFGTWHDYESDKSGTIVGYNGGNLWMALNSNGPASLTNLVGHRLGISLIAMLH